MRASTPGVARTEATNLKCSVSGGGKTYHWGGGFPTSRPGLYSSHREASPADSPRVYLATMALLLQRPCLMIAESGAPARAIRRASPTRPL